MEVFKFALVHLFFSCVGIIALPAAKMPCKCISVPLSLKVGNCWRQWWCSFSLYNLLIFRLWLQLSFNLRNFSNIFCKLLQSVKRIYRLFFELFEEIGSRLMNGLIFASYAKTLIVCFV